MSTGKKQLPSILFFVAGVLFLIAAFVPGDEPTNRLLVVIGIVLLALSAGTFRRAGGRPSIPN